MTQGPRAAFVVTAICLVLCACTRLFFQPSRRAFGKPEDFGAIYETVRFASRDGTELAGLFFPARRQPPLGTVLHFHGNAENMTSHFLFAVWLVDHGFNVMAFDYRGYGASAGRPSLAGAVQDGAAALRSLAARSDLDPARIVVFGQSLGGALALASIASLREPCVRAIALESTFASYPSLVQDKLARIWILWPLRWLLAQSLFSTRHDPVRVLSGLPRAPLLIIHGTADRIVPYQEGLRLYQRAREPKALWTIEGAGHTEAFTRFASSYRHRLVDFFERALADPAPPVCR